ncbi:MAG: ATP-binding protein [Mycobacteriales bacterium]
MSLRHQPNAVLPIAQAFEFVVCSAAVVVQVRARRRRASGANGWALVVFGVLALVLSFAPFTLKDDGSVLMHLLIILLVCLLLMVPFGLVQFARSLTALGPGASRLSQVLTGGVVAATVVSPRFPEPDAPRSHWFTGYIIAFVAAWAIQSWLAAWGLWTAGRGQPAVVRKRMRLLGAGALVVAVELIVGGSSSSKGGALELVTTVMGAAGIALLALAFMLPDWLRIVWRTSDLGELSAAERRLMSAVSAEEVGAAIVPAVARLFGAEGAALVDARGAVLAAVGLDASELGDLHGELPDGSVVLTPGGLFACRLCDGWLVMRPGIFAPIYGPAELSLLDRIGSFVDLALQRCVLFQREAHSRAAAETANAELQTLVHSVSHDLRNPIISVLGYLDVLAQEHAGELQGEGQHYLDRIAVNAAYMQHLIQDLLELSRIGRSEPPPQVVPVGSLAESVAEEVQALHPECAISVEGSFPVLWFSELRARQLLTNVIDNAAKHSRGRAEVTVTAEPGDGGSAVLLVSDTGLGIPPAYREKAFEVFERLDAAHGDVPGTGMGLPICKRIVEAADGRITLDGPPAGATTGTTVRIELPACHVQGWLPLKEMSP